jgi:alkaline phosphatase D
MQRRSFLRATLVSFPAALAAGCGKDGDDELDFVEDASFFPLSVASGDPRPESVVLWTRVVDPELPDTDLDVALLVWVGDDPDTAPMRVDLVAPTASDGCVKARVEGLVAGTNYLYRFVYLHADGRALSSREGRTKTAPAATADVPVRFAWVSCQDFIGKYFNAYAALAEEQLDFIVHLGDYVYETSGDASFQDVGSERALQFRDEEGALRIDTAESYFYAARSLDNYRDLYRTYRSDEALQRVHERFPMIVGWDDHEFSDDCHGATATYLDGRQDETDAERKRNATRAWSEYMPVDLPDGEPDPESWPDLVRIYRDFRWGRNVHLVLTDLRSFRSDHLVAEDAYPGAVVMDEAAMAASGGPAAYAGGYVDLADVDPGYTAVLQAAAEAAGYDPARIGGLTSAAWIDDVVTEAGSELPALLTDDLPQGLANHHMMKLGHFSQIGARYLVAAEPWSRYAAYRYAESEGASEEAMGVEQQQWFLDTMAGSDATWKIWANEFCLTTLGIDLSPLGLPPAFQRAFSLSAEDWNGMPNRRAAIIDALSDVPNVLAITGDIHAFFAATPFAGEVGGNKLVELVGGGISSTAYASLLARQVANDPLLSMTSGAESLAAAIKELLLVTGGPNPGLGFAATTDHGYAIAEVSASEVVATFAMHPEALDADRLYDDLDAIRGAQIIERFRVPAGERELEREIDGAWARWDPVSYRWV